MSSIDYTPPADADPPAEDTGSQFIERFIRAGEQWRSDETVPAGSGGVELWDGSAFIDTNAEMAAFGHALLAEFDPVDVDTCDTVGLDGSLIGKQTPGPYTWKDVALAAIARLQSKVYVATTDTRHYSWTGVGATEDEARDALMAAWHAHAADTGADPDYIQRDDINVVAGTFGQGFRDYTALP